MLNRLIHDTCGTAAAEMALIAPMLMGLMFGSFEMGSYFYANHLIAKAVRDGARYASRQSFSQYSCPSTVSSGVIDNTRNVTRTGQTANGGSPRLWYWTDANTITLSVQCADNSGGAYKGFYEGMAAVPVVRVTATVPYNSFFAALGFNSSGLTITAKSEAPVMGI